MAFLGVITSGWAIFWWTGYRAVDYDFKQLYCKRIHSFTKKRLALS